MKRSVLALTLVLAMHPGLAAEDDEFDVLDRLVEVERQGTAAMDQPVIMDFEAVALSKVFQAVSRAGGFEVRLDGVEGKLPVTISWQGITMRQALVELAKNHDLTYEVPEPGKLVVKSRHSSGKGSP